MQRVLAERGRRFLDITRRRISRVVFKSVADMEDVIKRYIADHNRHVKLFAWTKTADEILEKPTCILYILTRFVTGAAPARVLETFTPGLLLAQLQLSGLVDKPLLTNFNNLLNRA